MKWRLIKDEFPDYGDNEKFLVSDGKSVWVAFGDKGDLVFVSETCENEYEIRDRLTHWCWLHEVTLPGVNQLVYSGNVVINGDITLFGVITIPRKRREEENLREQE